MSPAELTSAEEVLERKGWVFLSRFSRFMKDWTAIAQLGAGKFSHDVEAPTRHQAREDVVRMAMETQTILDSRSDTERPPPMPEVAAE